MNWFKKKLEQQHETNMRIQEFRKRLQEARTVNDLPSWEEMKMYGTWSDFTHAMGILYTTHMELLKK